MEQFRSLPIRLALRQALYHIPLPRLLLHHKLQFPHLHPLATQFATRFDADSLLYAAKLLLPRRLRHNSHTRHGDFLLCLTKISNAIHLLIQYIHFKLIHQTCIKVKI